MTARRCLLLLGLLLALGMLMAACAPSAAQTEMPAEAVRTEVIKEEVVKTLEAQATVAPAVEEPQTPAATQAGQPFPTPTPSFPPLPTPVILPQTVEGRVLELEWPERMRLGDSDVVRLSLVPSKDGYTVTTEFQEHETYTQTLQVQRLSGYDLYAAARLDSVSFDLSPDAEQERLLNPGEPLTWYWSLTPHQPGQHRLSVLLLLRWKPVPGTNASPREMLAYARAMDIQVSSFFGLTRGQAMTGGLLGFLFGGGLTVFGAALLFGQPRPVLQAVAPNLALVIEPRPGLSLSPDETALMRSLFSRYARLVLEREFLSGYSGARTFLAQPVRTDGRADAYTIVKVGERDAIQREFENYETFVKDTPASRNGAYPACAGGRARGGRCGTCCAPVHLYWRAGHFSVQPAPGTALAKPDPALLRKLFETFGPNWWMQRHPYTFRWGLEYDRVLPTHYVHRAIQRTRRLLDGHALARGAGVQPGRPGLPARLCACERRADGRSLSLLGTAQPGQPPLRVRWLSLADPTHAAGAGGGHPLHLIRRLYPGDGSCGSARSTAAPARLAEPEPERHPVHHPRGFEPGKCAGRVRAGSSG